MILQKWQNPADCGKLRAMGYETHHTLSAPARAGRLLLADDTSQASSAYAAWLQDAGYEVIWAHHGDEAQALLQKEHFAAVLYNLTGGPGGALGAADRGQALASQHPRVPTVVISQTPAAQTPPPQANTHVVCHPISAASLLQALGEALRPPTVPEAGRAQPPSISQAAALLLSPTGLAPSTATMPSPAPELAGELDLALASLFMAYQPIVDCARHTLFGYEALVRSNPGNLASPPALLAAAESLGRLQELSRQIRAQVAQDIARIPADASACRLFVNLHAQDLLDPSLFDPEAPLSKHAHRIVLEVTERTPLEEVPDVQSRVARLRAMGYRLALDDLGAGYAGLSTFAQLEPEVVKLDMALVRQVERSRTKRHIIASMVQLCERLGTHVVAEGIETIAERDVLLALGCQLLQGYYFGRPTRAFERPTY